METTNKCEGYCPQCTIAKKPNFNWDMCVKVNTISLLHRIVVAVEGDDPNIDIIQGLRNFEESVNIGSAATPEKDGDDKK